MSASSPMVPSISDMQRRSGVPLLCRDVINILIDFLSTEKDTLLACSLVGRDWVHRSQTHLLHDVSLSDQDHLALFTLTLPSITERVRRMVRVLNVGFCASRCGPMQITRAQVISLLDLLPMLHELRLCDLQLCGIGDPLGAQYIPRSLGVLSFRDVMDASASQSCPIEMIAFICLFCKIDRLDISSTQCLRDMWYPTVLETSICSVILRSYCTMPISICVGDISINRAPVAVPLLQFLRIGGAVRTLRTAFISCLRMSALVALQEFLADGSGIIKRLDIDFIPYTKLVNMGEPLNWVINPSLFSRLRMLYVRINFDAFSLQASVYMWNRLVDLLGHLSKARVETLEIAIRTESLSPSISLECIPLTFRELDWLRLDQVLRRYRNLSEDACIQVYDTEEKERTVSRYLEIIFYRLPLCKQEGRVRLEWLCWSRNGLTVKRPYLDMMGPIRAMLRQV